MKSTTIKGQKETIEELEKGKLAEKLAKEKTTNSFNDLQKWPKWKMLQTQEWTEIYTSSLEKGIDELQHQVKKQKETIDQLLKDNATLYDETSCTWTVLRTEVEEIKELFFFSIKT